MVREREQLIRRAAQRAIRALADEHHMVGVGGLFELAFPFVAADVPDASPEEIRAAFVTVWGLAPLDRAVCERVLSVCDRHSPGESETIEQVLQRASKGGDVEAAYLLALVKSTR